VGHLYAISTTSPWGYFIPIGETFGDMKAALDVNAIGFPRSPVIGELMKPEATHTLPTHNPKPDPWEKRAEPTEPEKSEGFQSSGRTPCEQYRNTNLTPTRATVSVNTGGDVEEQRLPVAVERLSEHHHTPTPGKASPLTFNSGKLPSTLVTSSEIGCSPGCRSCGSCCWYELSRLSILPAGAALWDSWWLCSGLCDRCPSCVSLLHLWVP
jgi:hypothetical protein